ncbi:antitoxin Xre/MbcA/ParS toxin-binding domain-containing protein [uncultured Thiodictyon sp.]|jgi:putative toxin-antitoxin system antitoxin component (TIGR02293 family)|uniref:type II RES/Xre toxin-antitoxin system antitoxin n=1 Tax=uncultured Thiodictyon sp. TaxID=1846217 RepID=UPI0025E11FB6|nr:antitoxin Xre/MbcA/ParS toxin-binding domain-containing protein [uncultured Thiodictyon sp.]
MTATARYHVPDLGVGTPAHGRAGAATLGFLGVAEAGAGVFETVRAGLPAAVIERLAKSLEVTQRDLLGIAAIAPATLTRRRRAAPMRLSAAESDRVYRIAAAFEDAVRLFEGDQAAARAWLKAPAKALGGQTPLEYLSTETGAAEVRRLIGRLEQGVYT